MKESHPLRILQILLPGASAYERKSQRIDYDSLQARHDVRLIAPDEIAAVQADVAHVYGPIESAAKLFRNFLLPYLASGRPRRRRFSWWQPALPEYVVQPVANDQNDVELLPEAVEDQYFDAVPSPRPDAAPRVLGTYAGNRPGVVSIVEQALARIHRFRDDVIWTRFDAPPTPEDLRGVDAWVDPALTEEDLDGFAAEALVAGLPVVASRTKVNIQRMESGRTGFLVPSRDPNELTHAILAALFKPEMREPKIAAARQTISKFRPRQRLRILAHMYETLVTKPN